MSWCWRSLTMIKLNWRKGHIYKYINVYIASLANLKCEWLPSDALRNISVALSNFKSNIDFNCCTKNELAKGQNFFLQDEKSIFLSNNPTSNDKLRPKHTFIYSITDRHCLNVLIWHCGALQEGDFLVSAALAAALHHYNEPCYCIKLTSAL